MARFGVIADDFTGACDVGIQFKKVGLETIVLTNAETYRKIKNFDVTVIDTESRNDPPDVAYDKVREAVKALKNMGARLKYKKVDSTLRGNIGVELDAVIDELDLKAVIVSPAFPATNRLTLNGRQLVNGIPLEKTEFAKDAVNPVKDSHIPTLIKKQTRRKTELIDISKIREGIEPLKRRIQNLIKNGCEILVADAETEDDLRVIAKAALDSKILPCGSAGLAQGVSYWLASNLAKRIIVFSGSVNSVTLNQIQVAEKSEKIKVFKPHLSEVLADWKKRKAEIDRLIEETKAAFADGKDVILTLAKSRDNVLKIQQIAKNLKTDNLKVAEKILSFIGEISSEITHKCKIVGLVLIGGDTAIKVMNAIGAYGIRVEEEFLPGIPFGKLLGGRLNGLPIITKAGGFGQEDTLMKAIEKLRHSSKNSK